MSSMAAAEGSTLAGSAPKIQATSMHKVGRTLLPPASIEYLIASSSPPRGASPVNLRACKYSSKRRRCASHRSWLFVGLGPIAMPYLAVRPQPCAPQHPADEGRRLLAREPPGELDGLVYGHVGRYVLHVEHLVEREAQDRTVHRAHAVHGPPHGDLGEHGVEPFLLFFDAAREIDGVLLQMPPVLPPALHRGVERALVDVALVQVQERLLAGRPAAQVALPQTLVRYSLERVSTRTRSPTLTKSGTCTTTPVSSVAGLLPPVAVSPLRPGSVSATSRSTCAGGSTLTTSPSAESTLTVPFGTMYPSASPTASRETASCS